MELIYEFLSKLSIKEDDVLVVGVSFGPDSMYLLYLLKQYFKNNKIICAHIHHNHRKESDDEALLLEKFCNENDIIFEFMKINEYNNNKFTEEEARSKRYEFFESLIKKYNSKYLFTAHHGDDLIETVLMRIVRGSNLKGYSAINLVSNRDNYKIVRPLLYVDKKTILEQCNKNNIPYANDLSNTDERYTRNRYRNNVLPVLKKENKDVHMKFLDFSNNMKEYHDYIMDNVNIAYEKCVNNNIIDVDLLNKEHDLIIKNVIEQYLLNIYKENIKLVNNNHVNSTAKMIKTNKSNMVISLPLNINLIKSYNKIYFDIKREYNNYCFALDSEVVLPNGYVIKRVEKLDNTTNYVAAFNSKDIKLTLYVRSKKDGDKIEVLGLNGSKKIKDIFIDEKINKEKRINYPILVDSNDTILWIPGIKKSKYDKSKTGNYDIMLKYMKEEYNEE